MTFSPYDEYGSPDYDDDDRREDARRDAAEDEFDRVAVVCGECGERYDPEVHRATRLEPAWVGRDCCPRCGSDAVVGREVSAGFEMVPGGVDGTDPF